MKRLRRSDRIWPAITLTTWVAGFVFCVMAMLRRVVFTNLLLAALANSDAYPVAKGFNRLGEEPQEVP